MPDLLGKMVCRGGCPAHLNAAGNNRLCGGYYRFFSDILAPLRPFSRDLNGLKAGGPRLLGLRILRSALP